MENHSQISVRTLKLLRKSCCSVTWAVCRHVPCSVLLQCSASVVTVRDVARCSLARCRPLDTRHTCRHHFPASTLIPPRCSRKPTVRRCRRRRCDVWLIDGLTLVLIPLHVELRHRCEKTERCLYTFSFPWNEFYMFLTFIFMFILLCTYWNGRYTRLPRPLCSALTAYWAEMWFSENGHFIANIFSDWLREVACVVMPLFASCVLVHSCAFLHFVHYVYILQRGLCACK